MGQNSDKAEKFRSKVIAYLETQSLEDISYILGRYCGPSNQLLSEKKYGYVMPKDVVENYFKTRIMEEALFGTDTQ